jgi:hypothetical protein
MDSGLLVSDFSDVLSLLQQRGRFKWECFNPDGSLAWKDEHKNGATTSGLNDFLNTYFDNSTAKKNTWYLGLIDNSGFTSLSSSDTMSSHTGWTELTSYSEGTRPQWTPAAAAGGSITNSSTVNFTINATVAVKGAFIVSNNTKGGTTGQLFATGLLSSLQNLTNGQVLKLTYTCPLTPTS